MAVIATDNFNRADSQSLGANWTSDGTGPAIVANQEGQTSTASQENSAAYTAATWPNNHYTQAVISNIRASAKFGVGCRMQNNANREGFFGGFDPNDFTARNRIWKKVGAAITSLAADIAAQDFVVGDTCRLEDGKTGANNLELFRNGVSRLTATDAAFASGKAGVWTQHGTASIALMDNWEGGDFITFAPDEDYWTVFQPPPVDPMISVW